VVLGPVASTVLSQFLLGKYFSPYKIQKMLKNKGENHAYKDVHKRIQRLYSLELIERVPEDQIHGERTLHNPIFYRLTIGGLFNLLYENGDVMFTEDKKKIFLYHGDNIIFNTFIYPYIEQSTLIGIKGSFLPEIIFDYISKCCGIIDEIIEGLAGDGGFRPFPIDLFRWSEVPGEYDIQTVRKMANEFEVDFSEESKIEKYNDERTIKISDKNHCVIIQLNQKMNSATLTVHDGRTCELIVEQVEDDDELIVKKKGTFRQDVALSVMGDRVQSNLLNLAFSILMAVKIGGTEADFVEARVPIDTKDFEILTQDAKAMDLIEETHKLFTERYRLFSELKNMNSNT